MASASRTEIFRCTPAEFYLIVSDYEKYPEFLSDVRGCKVLERTGGRVLIEYQIQIIKSFKYTLWMTEDQPKSIKWQFDKGDIFKTMEGSWVLEAPATDHGASPGAPATDRGAPQGAPATNCRASYSLEATVGLWVPSAVTKALIEVNLPNMMASYHKRIKDLYGKG